MSHTCADPAEGRRTYVISNHRLTLLQCIHYAKLALRDVFGVRSLSLIELNYLRECAMQVADSLSRQWIERRAGNVKRSSIPSLGDEIAWLWLSRCYGVDPVTIRRELARLGCASRELYEWLALERARSHML